MLRHFGLGLIFAATWTASSSAQSPAPRFHWQAGQTLVYRVEQNTTVADTADGKTETSVTKLSLSKRWQIQSVDAAGVATLQLTLLTLRMEMGKAGAAPTIFDSQNVDPANAALNKELLQYIGKPIATLRLDRQGRLIDVTESKFGPASRFSSELPFRITLPDTAPLEGQSWQRSYQVKLEPPQGAGEKFDAVQTYSCKTIGPDSLIVAIATVIKDQPDAPVDRIPLVPHTPQGAIVFDAATGRMKKAELKMEAEFADHRGEGSKYRFTSNYLEELVEK